MRPLTLEDAIRDVVVIENGLIDREDMVFAIAERIREGFIIPILEKHGLPVPTEVAQ